MKAVLAKLCTLVLLLLIAVACHADVITGKVVDAKNNPIANADVLVRTLIDFDKPIQFHQIKADANGVFAIDPKIAGQLHAIAWAIAPGKAPFGISLNKKENVIRLENAEIISGRVVDQNNNPVKGVNVRFAALAGGKDRSRYVDLRATPWKERLSATTDAQGKWQLRCVPVGDVASLQVRDNRFVTVGLRVKVGQDTILTQVRPGAVLSGRVVDNKGKPLANVTVLTFGGNSSHVGNATSETDGEGKYVLPGLPSGTYLISPSTESLVAPTLDNIIAIEGKTTSVPDIVMTPGGIISGQVINSKTKKPVHGTEIGIHNINKKFPFDTAVLTNQKGEYQQRLVPGRYQIIITSGGEGYLEQGITRDVTIEEGQAETQSFAVDPGTKLSPIENVDSPEERIRSFLRTMSVMCKFNFSATYYVSGVAPDNPLEKSVCQAFADTAGKMNIEASDFVIVPDLKDAKLATATFTLSFSDNALGYELLERDRVRVRLETDESGQQNWKIIPLLPDFFLDKFYLNDTPPRKSTFTNYWASLIAYPQQMQNGFHLYKSEMQIEKLGKELFMYALDYDNQINFLPEQLKEKLTPYIESESLFTAPGDPVGTTSYSMNPNIKGLNLQGLDLVSQTGVLILSNRSSEKLPSPHTMVMLYLGHDQKFNFKYGGYSVVCFMDGHVERVTQEQAKKLRWKP